MAGVLPITDLGSAVIEAIAPLDQVSSLIEQEEVYRADEILYAIAHLLWDDVPLIERILHLQTPLERREVPTGFG
jgi:hypothetical protein